MNTYSGADAKVGRSSDLSASMRWSPQTWSSMAWRLFWKEFRQILPLLWALIAIGAMLQMIGAIHTALNPGLSNASLHQAALVLMPSLFAVGAGAMLVSQEKELRTLSWLSSLPISAPRIVMTKFVSGLVGLLLCWMGCLLSAAIASPDVFDNRIHTGLYESIGNLGVKYFVNSLFLLVASMVSGWIFKTAWVALVMMIPFAILPVFVIAMVVTSRTSEIWMQSPLGAGLVYLGSAIVLILLGRVWGRNSFVSAPTRWFGQFSYRAPSRMRMRTIMDDWRPLPVAPSLLWQIGWQNRMLWVSVVFIALSFFSAFILAWEKDGGLAGILVVPNFIVFTWLGASTFGSDGNNKRIQFLADRGVTPGVIWWTRQFFPLCIVVLGFGSLLLAWVLLTGPNGRSARGLAPFPVFVFLGGMFAIYSATQWVSQIFRSSLLNMCVAPAVGVGTMAALAFAFSTLGTGYLWLIPSVLIMFFASRAMMRPWMDARYTKRTYLQHAGFGLLACVFPAIPFITTVLTYPSISNEAYRELTDLARRTPVIRANSSIRLNSFGQVSMPESVSEMGGTVAGGDALGGDGSAGELEPPPTKPAPIDWDERIDSSVENLLSLYATPNLHPQIPHHLIQSWIATLRRTSLTLAGKPSEERVRVETERYQRVMTLLLHIATSHRQQTELMSQEVADQVERAMIREIADPANRSLLDNALLASILRQLGDNAGRQEARLKALAVSWNQSMVNPIKPRRDELGWTINDFSQVGGIEIPQMPATALLSAELVRKRRVGLAVETLYRFLKSGNRSASNSDFKAYQDFWSIGDTSDRSYYEPIQVSRGSVGSLWFGDWENTAEALAKDLQETLP
ncbi:ABC transporter permease [Pirellulaceae bacterium SH467]